MPNDVVEFEVDEIVKLWRKNKLRTVGKKRALTLVAAAKRGVGVPEGNCVRLDLQLLLEDYSKKKTQLDRIATALQEETLREPNVEKLFVVKGVGIIAVAGFLAEVGDVGRFKPLKRTQKLAGLEPKENGSGKHKGSSSISERGRRRLRRLIFQVFLPLIRSKEDFREVYNLLHDSQGQSFKGYAGNNCSELQSDPHFLCSIDTWNGLQQHTIPCGYYPPGTGKGCLTRPKLLSGKVAACKNAEWQKGTELRNLSWLAALELYLEVRLCFGATVAPIGGEAERRNLGLRVSDEPAGRERLAAAESWGQWPLKRCVHWRT